MKFQKDVIRNDEDLIKLPVPKCYLGKHVPFDVSQTGPDSDDEINESIIVLEDLKKQGYQSTPFKNGLTLEQAKASFVAISKIHSLSLAMKVNNFLVDLVSCRFFDEANIIIIIIICPVAREKKPEGKIRFSISNGKNIFVLSATHGKGIPATHTIPRKQKRHERRHRVFARNQTQNKTPD